MESILARLGKSIVAMEAALTSARSLKIDLTEESKGRSFANYKAQRREYYKKRFSNALEESQKCMNELIDTQRRAYPISELQRLLRKVNESVDENEMLTVEKALNRMKKLVPTDGVSKKVEQPRSFEIPAALPRAISDDITADIREMEKCYQSQCYRSAIILCGRVLETALHRKYYEHTNNDLLETSPGIGLGKIIAKMSSADISLPVGLNEQIHLINNVRISSVHKKKQLFVPSKDQTMAIILYTLDTLKSIF